jgi:hypothetical protein
VDPIAQQIQDFRNQQIQDFKNCESNANRTNKRGKARNSRLSSPWPPFEELGISASRGKTRECQKLHAGEQEKFFNESNIYCFTGILT